MGLPLFKIPTEPEAIAGSPEKTVAAARSAIRRRPVARARSGLGVRQRLEERYEALENAAEYATELRDRHIARHRQLESTLMRLRSPENYDSVRLGDIERPIIDRDPSYQNIPRVPGEHTALARVRALRERLDRHQYQARPASRNAAPTPPYNENDGDSFEMPPVLPRPAVMTPALSPPPLSGSASPARQAVSNDNASTLSSRTQDSARRSMLAARIRALDRTSGDLGRRSRNHLRRARIYRQSQLDGLGDRTRSVSPDGAWDTLLTSITPDPQPPSVGSSFASTSAAAATISISNSPTSPITSMDESATSQDPSPNDCDLSDDNTVDDEEDIYELLELDSRGERRNHEWRTFSTSARSSGRAQEQLEGMHQVIQGLVEREDIPDEWWMSVGLSRNV